jgi:hypothetical protein
MIKLKTRRNIMNALMEAGSAGAPQKGRGHQKAKSEE